MSRLPRSFLAKRGSSFPGKSDIFRRSSITPPKTATTRFADLEEQAGELKRIAQPVATELEITELADREMKSPGGGKALLIEKPTRFPTPSP